MAKKEFKDENGKTYVAKEKKPFYKKVWFWIIAVILVAALFSQGKDSKNDVSVKQKDTTTSQTEEKAQEPKEETQEEQPAPYELTDVTTETDGYNYFVTGILKNNTDSDKKYVQIQFSAKDQVGNKIGDALDNVNNLKAGDTWKFKALLLETTDGEPQFDLENPEISGF